MCFRLLPLPLSLGSMLMMWNICIGSFIMWVARHIINYVKSKPVNHEVIHRLFLVCMQWCFLNWLRDT